MSSISAHIPAPVRSLLTRGLGSAVVSGLAGVFVLTLAGKIVAFVKDAMVASTFGVSDSLDAFMLVFGLMTFAATMLAGGLPESFLPAYVALKHRRGARRADRMAVQTCLFHLASVVLVGACMVLAGHQFIEHFASGFSAAKRELAQHLLVRLAPFMICFGMSYQFGAWMRADKRFFLVAGAPLLVPLTIIVFLLATRTAPDVNVLLLGTNIGAALQCAVLLRTLWRQLPGDWRWWGRVLRVWEPSLRIAGRNALPFLIGGIAFSSAAVVDQTMASWLPAGSVTVLGYSDKLCMIILGVSAGPLADVLFPYFADHVARQDWAGLRRRLLTSVGVIVGLTLPLVLLLDLLAPWVVRVLFERGAFTHEDTLRVAEVVRFGALQIPFYILGIVTARVVVSLQASKLMVAISFGALGANALFNWLLMRHMGAAGIALSTALVHGANALFVCAWCLRLIRQKEAAS